MRLPLRPGCPITSADLVEVKRVRHALIASSYRAVAVHSPWSAYADKGAGKQPVTEMRDGKRRPWTEGQSPKRLANITPTSANTGIVLGGQHQLVAMDLDPAKTVPATEQQAFSLDLLRLLRNDALWSALAEAPMRLRPPASVVLLFRTDLPMAKIRVQGTRGAVELLGNGQHVVVHGWHPLSITGGVVRWSWRHGHAPWTVTALALPVVGSAEVHRLMNSIAASGVLGARVAHTTAPGGAGASRARVSAYEATGRLRSLLEKHNGLVKPAIRELISEIGHEGHGRHDAVVAITGRLVHQGWTEEQVVEFLAPLVDVAFSEGSWLGEIEAALRHAKMRAAERSCGMKGVTW